jgi:hypothetical protein
MLPCATCPWRVDKYASTIPRYNHEKACGLTSTVGDGDAMRPIMACHHSTDENQYACNGELAREGWKNINVRLLIIKRKINSPADVLSAREAAGIELHKDYQSVLEKLEQSL